MDPNTLAIEWMRALEQGGALPARIAFHSELDRAMLDGSPESVERLDRLLAQVRSTGAANPQAWEMLPGSEDFLWFVCFYLGRVLTRASAVPVQWLTHAQAAPRMPADMPLPDERWARLVGIIGDSPLVPLTVVEDALFGANPSMSCRQYLARWLQRVEGIGARMLAQEQSSDENARCKELLAAMSLASPSTEIAYRRDVLALGLDGSGASLKRLDSLLRAIRARDKPSFAGFVGRLPTQSFMRWAAFYAGMAAARQARTSIKWLNYAELRAAAAEIEFQFETSSACAIGGRLFFPLGVVTEILFDPKPQRTLEHWARGIDVRTTERLVHVRRRRGPGAPATKLDSPWFRAAHQAGVLAAWAMRIVAEDGALAPLMLVPHADGGHTFHDFSMYGDVAKALQVADERLDKNPQKLAYQAMAFDGYANLPTGRTDAVTVDLRCYAGTSLSAQKAMVLKIACPYRPPSDPLGFAVHTPILLDASAPDTVHPPLFDSFYAGIDSFKHDTHAWDRHPVVED